MARRPSFPLLLAAVVMAALTVVSWPHAEETAAADITLAPIEGAPFSHFPYEAGECSSCHEGDASAPGKVQEGGDSLCFLCHSDVEEVRTKSKFVHNVNGSCTDCHNPHNSRQPALLLDTPRNVCTSCHTDIADAMRAATTDHGPMNSEQACTACHASHGSDNESVLITDEKQLCMLCHMQPQRATDGHMVPNMMEQLASAPVTHKPVTERCATCHSPHGATQPKLLAKPFPPGPYARFSPEAYGLCFSCHKDTLVTERTTTTATAFRDGDKNLHSVHVDRGDRGRSCKLCHVPHVAPRAGLIPDDVAYGSHGWRLPLNYTKTAEGGSCAKTCHLVREYTRTK